MISRRGLLLAAVAAPVAAAVPSAVPHRTLTFAGAAPDADLIYGTDLSGMEIDLTVVWERLRAPMGDHYIFRYVGEIVHAH